MNIDDFNFEEDMAVDPNALEEEWLRHPQLYMKYVKASALFKRKANKAVEKVKVIRSQLIKDSKGTAQEKEAFYRTHPDHIAAKEEMIQAEYEAAIVDGAIYALAHRKAELENLVKLYMSEYFSTPREPKQLIEGGKRIEREKVSQAEATQRSALNQRRTKRG